MRSDVKIKRIGVLTSGGDAPGMNAALRAVIRTAHRKKIEVVGILNGYSGLLEGNTKVLSKRDGSYIINRGGTILYTARSEVFKTPEGVKQGAEMCRKLELDGLIVLGGDGTFRGAYDLANEGIPCVGIPCTIDNDVCCTDKTIGFDTAMNTVVELADKIRDTGESHSRCIIIEVMGRKAGDIALHTAVAIGATCAVVPEYPFDRDELVNKIINSRAGGKKNFLIVVAEGLGKDYGIELAKYIEEKTNIESRFSCFGYTQRGGSPSLSDRVLASTMGCAAVYALLDGCVGDVVVSKGSSIETVEMKYAIQLERLAKGKMTEAEKSELSPGTFYEMSKTLADRMAYKSYLKGVIEKLSL
ncbi:MAG: 6-phosphofructokinase [Ruminococcaceae bacterium]|nr:6-phosphofructokinase [Oscillospiraceae bacterium]